MANSTQIRTGLNTLVQDHVSDKLQNTLFNRMPLLYFLFAKDGEKDGPLGLGRPKTAIFLTGVDTARARREEILGAQAYEPIIQTSGPAITDGKVLAHADNMPVRTSWESNLTEGYFTRPRVKWVERADPYKISNKSVRRTKRRAANELDARAAIGSLFTAETTSVLATHTKWWNQSLWGTTGNGYPSNEDAQDWDSIHSIQNALKADNTYCGVDRSVTANSYWRGNYTTTATAADFETIINQCNYDFGMSSKGTGVDLILVDGTNFKKAKSEAKAKGHQVIFNGKMEEYGQFGFSRELVKIDNTYIVYDPECPSGHVAALNLATWTFAMSPDANFTVTGPDDQTKIEGGDDAMTGVIRTEVLIVCECPSLNSYYTAVA